MPPSYQRFRKKGSRPLGLLGGLGVSVLLFLAIPLTQIFTEYRKAPLEIMAIEMAPPPPPPPPEDPPPPPEPEEEPPLPEFEPPPPPITLEQLEVALEAGIGEAVAGDFAMPNLSIQTEELGSLDIFDIMDLDKKPTVLRQPAPMYPPRARQQGLTGNVRVSFVIDQNGSVVSVRVISSTDPIFEAPTIDAVRQWRFTPGEKDGKVVTTRAETRVPYQIR
ncbi:MAG: energy transducer TonB [Opitutales bacterium]